MGVWNACSGFRYGVLISESSAFHIGSKEACDELQALRNDLIVLSMFLHQVRNLLSLFADLRMAGHSNK
jgi:hypothetical protein